MIGVGKALVSCLSLACDLARTGSRGVLSSGSLRLLAAVRSAPSMAIDSFR